MERRVMLKREGGLIIFFHWKGKGGLQENLSPRLKIRFRITLLRFIGPYWSMYLLCLKILPSILNSRRRLLRAMKESRGRAWGEKEKRPPLPFACSPRTARKKNNNRRMLRRLILNCFHRWYQGRKCAKEVSSFQLYCGWRRMCEAPKLPTF